MAIIVPAILTADNEELVEKMKQAEEFVDRIQVDVMNNTFVPFESTSGNALESPCTLEAHLMIDEPNIAEYSNFDVIIIHAEACKEIGRTISEIKALDIRAGLAINPETSVDSIKQFIPEVDQVTVMTVHPGKQGQKFMPEMMEKVKQIKGEFPNVLVEVDGGITEDNIHQAVEAGADLIGVGHFLFESDNFKERFKKLLRAE